MRIDRIDVNFDSHTTWLAASLNRIKLVSGEKQLFNRQDRKERDKTDFIGHPLSSFVHPLISQGKRASQGLARGIHVGEDNRG